MDIANNIAARGYAASRPATAPKPDSPESSGLNQAAKSFADTLREGEVVAMQSMTGGADPHSLVQALAQTELAVETAVAVRNKVVEAYQEILRMPV